MTEKHATRVWIWGAKPHLVRLPLAPLTLELEDLGYGASCFSFWLHDSPVAEAILREKAFELGLNIAFLPGDFSVKHYKVLCSDMDGTLIDDEVFALLTKEYHVEKAYEDVMAQPLEQSASLQARARLLAGMKASALPVLTKHLKLQPEVKAWIARTKDEGLQSYIVSSGIKAMADVMADELGMTGAVANRLQEKDGLLTGVMEGPQPQHPLLHGELKAKALAHLASINNATPEEVIAQGDSGNDVAMLQTAGLSIAVGTSAALRSFADVVLNEGAFAQWLVLLRRVDPQ